MGRLTAEADEQVAELAEHFLRKDRTEAVHRLTEAVGAALTRVDDANTRWRTAPTPYAALADEGFRWFRQHRYWIAYSMEADGQGAIHHVIYDTANIPARLRGRS